MNVGRAIRSFGTPRAASLPYEDRDIGEQPGCQQILEQNHVTEHVLGE